MEMTDERHDYAKLRPWERTGEELYERYLWQSSPLRDHWRFAEDSS